MLLFSCSWTTDDILQILFKSLAQLFGNKKQIWGNTSSFLQSSAVRLAEINCPGTTFTLLGFLPFVPFEIARNFSISSGVRTSH